MQNNITGSRLRNREWIADHRWLKVLGLQVAFLALSVLMFYSIIRAGKAIYSVDNIFHWQRITELADDFRHGVFPQFNTYTGLLGTATPTTYPGLNFIPSALLRLMGVAPVTVINIYLVSTMYLGLNLAFYSYRSLKRSKLSSFVFATLYCVCTMFSGLEFPQAELGEMFAIMFAPLAFIGWIHFIRHNRYRMMTTGLVFMATSHIMSTLIMIVGLGIMTLLSAKDVNKEKLVTGFKAGATFLLTTMIIWLPTLILLKTNQISTPVQLPMAKTATLIPLNIKMATANAIRIWWLTDIIAVLFGICNFNHLSRLTKKTFILALVLLACNFNWLPWSWIQSTFLGYMQFAYRLTFLSHLLLMLVLAEVFVREYQPGDRVRSITIYSTMILLTVLSISVFNFAGANLNAGRKVNMNNIYSINPHEPTRIWVINKSGLELTNSNLKDPRTLRMLTNSDYMQESTIKHLEVKDAKRTNQTGTSTLIDHKQYGNQISFTAKRFEKHVRIPLTVYHSQKYRLVLNGKPIKYSTIDGLVKISNVPKGRNVITYQTPVMWYRWLAIICTVTGAIILIMPRKRRCKGLAKSILR